MVTKVRWGINADGHAQGSYGGGSPLVPEETLDTTNTPPHTFAGTAAYKFDVRTYYRCSKAVSTGPTIVPPTTLTTADKAFFAEGRQLLLSVSNFPYNSVSSYQTQWKNFFKLLLGVGTGSFDYAGSTPGKVLFVPFHEMDNSPTSIGTPAGYKSMVPILRGWYEAECTAAGLPFSRVEWIWLPTAWGFDGYIANGTCRAANHWDSATFPAIFDTMGADGYNGSGFSIGVVGGSFNASKWRPFASTGSGPAVFRESLAFINSVGKPMIVGELGTVAYGQGGTVDTVKTKQWGIDMGAYLAAQSVIKAVYIWYGNPPGDTGESLWAYDYATAPSKHEGYRLAIVATSSGTTPGALPTPPTGSEAVSASDGLSFTLTWAAPPGGDSVTGWNVYLKNSANVFVKQNVSPRALTPRSYTFTGTAPGTGYQVTVTAVNATGSSGFAATTLLTTSQPSVGNAPAMGAITATESSTIAGAITLSIPWSDPQSTTDTVLVTWGDGASSTLSTAASPAVLTHEYLASGSYTITVRITDPTGLFVTSSLTTTVDLGDNTDPVYGWPLIQSGHPLGALTSYLRNLATNISHDLVSIDQRSSFQLYDGTGTEVRGSVVLKGGLTATDEAPSTTYPSGRTLLSVVRNFTVRASASEVWSMTSGISETAGNKTRMEVDLRGVTSLRLRVNISVAGPSGSVLAAQYSLDAGTTWKNFNGSAGTTLAGATVAGDAGGSGTLVKSSWVDIPAEAQIEELLIRVAGNNPTGTANINTNTIQLSVR